jgi:glycyl-tRNA synthetase alpha chain
VWLDGLEITQFTYFQQVGGIDLDPISAELTYGLERIAMYIQGVDDFKHIQWVNGVTYADVHLQEEIEHCRYNFEEASIEALFQLFSLSEREADRLVGAGLVHPAYEQVLKCSHLFNLLEARGALSVTERTGYIARVRNLARKVARAYVAALEKS